MSLRTDLIEAGAKADYEENALGLKGWVPRWDEEVEPVKEQSREDVAVILDAMLDLLTERADEWDGASFEFSSPPRTQPSNSIESLLDALRDPEAAVLRNPGSVLEESEQHPDDKSD